MKKVILSVLALTVMGTMANAQDASKAPVAPPADAAIAAQATPQAAPQAQGEQKVKVEATALPDALKKMLTTDEYKDWQYVSGWKVTGATEYYVLELQKGEEKRTLKLDKDGRQV